MTNNRSSRTMTPRHPVTTITAMNANHVLGLAHSAAAVKNVPPGAGGFHVGIIPIALLLFVLGGIGYSVSRARRGRTSAQHDDEWGRREQRPPAAAPTAPEPSGVAPAHDLGAAPARARRDVSFERPAGGWAVETHGLTKRFGSNVAVNDVELSVPRGSAFGYLGPNGAGKTTLIRTLLGLTRSNGGTTSLLGIPVPAERSRALAAVGAIVDEPRFHPHLTGRDNLRLLAAARGGDAASRIAPSLQRVGLTERADHKVSSYSMGMRQRLGVASCLLGDPKLLILDEPMNGLDPAGMHQMREMIVSLADEGRTVMLSSHLLDEVERTCDAVAIVDRGRVIRQGPIDELIRAAGTASVQVDCADPARAARLIDDAGIAAGTSLTDAGLTVALPAAASRELVADINRRLVAAGISVYGLQEVRASLEDWFLSVTTRLGEQP
jgi:ABC-2 type transport system ATP-binding protein